MEVNPSPSRRSQAVMSIPCTSPPALRDRTRLNPMACLGTLAPAPAILLTGIVNAASFSPVIAPGGFAAIFGTGLAATTRTWTRSDFVDGKLPTQLDGVSVTIDGKAAYVYFVSPDQSISSSRPIRRVGPFPHL